MWRRGMLRGSSLLAAVAAIALIGCAGGQETAPAPFATSDSEVRAECLSGTYLPEQVGQRVSERPPPQDWRRIEDAPRTLQTDRAGVALTLRPRRPGERVVLTDVRVDVEHLPLRPLGVVFFRPCERQLNGPAIEADVDGSGQVVATSAALDGAIAPGLRLPEDARPIEFPWTIELDRPLRIYFIARAEHCFCRWSIDIPWRSEGGEGTIRIDNGGRGYTMTDSIGIAWNRPGRSGRWVAMEPPAPIPADRAQSTWIGVK